ncbi:hypothetical protein DI005_18290 [Prauserella sp. PE36]|uniref:RNA polymerase-binding protein RbpA n=1 Tax=Amycolatopsis marina TaxID=490629 RepID=A0A1I1BGB6_9PSEU|nr:MULTISPECIES: RNA polymerase-binding protein RbpA [Pseudonocardiaceae]RBM18645.1 hypothetical protein DI005_18290 [Prauserella sp. PE36]SFB49409.1 RNA polymerase-binding protein [Amycolatopsis marina]
MPRGTLRGYRWGHTTVEPDRYTGPVARVTARFACTRGHEFTVHFASDAELPASWTCRLHGVEGCARLGATATATAAGKGKGKSPRTHLTMLYERRSVAELEILLADTLAAIRRRGGAQPGCVQFGDRTYSFRYDG